MQKSHSVAFYFFHNKTFPSKQTRSQLSLKFYPDANALRRTEKSILLCYHSSSQLKKIEGNNFAGVWCREAYVLFSIAGVRECGHVQIFTHEQTLSRAE